MRKLHLMRHAKAGAGDASTGDADRRITARGLQDSMAMAEWLAKATSRPAAILCSSARRTQETLALLLPYLTPVAEVRIEKALYLATCAEILGIVAAVPDDREELLLIGHNEGLHEAAVALGREGEDGLVSRLRSSFPTAAIAAIETDGSWAELARDGGRLAAFVTPRDLRCD